MTMVADGETRAEDRETGSLALVTLARDHWLVLLAAALASAIAVSGDGGDMLRQLSRGLRIVGAEELLFVVLIFAVAFLWIGVRVRRHLRREVAARTAAERAALALSTSDPLTGIANRRVLDRRLSEPLGPGVRCVIVVDIDNFKTINDLRGHEAGDAVLVAVATRLQALAGETGATLVRMGGDEFTLIADLDDADAGSALAERVAERIAPPIELKNGLLNVSASVGVAVGGGEGPALLLRQADADMYRCKRARARGEDSAAAATDIDAGETGARRRFLEAALAEDPASARRCLYIALIAIDRLAGIRRIAGNDRCSLLIRELAERVRGADPAIRIDRWTGDTLGIGFYAEDAADAVRRMDAVRDLMQADVVVDGHPICVTVTAGLAGPGRLADLRVLTDQAQIAIDRAHAERARFVHLGADAADADDPLRLMHDLKNGIARGELWVCYQPKMAAGTGAIDSMEALVRWDHPRHGFLPPDSFITLAEQTGAIREVTRFVLERVARDMATLADAGHRLPVYVNLSARLLSDAAFVREVVAQLSASPHAIGLEITETAVLEDPQTAIRHVQELKAAGISIAIDDYGAGMSSLAYLKQLPADELKIDRMFVADLTSDHRDPLLVRSTIDLAHGLGMRVTAEGVDTPASMALLKVMGCDLLQGYLIAKPLSLDDLVAFLGRPPLAAGMLVSAGALFTTDAYWKADDQDARAA